MVGRAPTANRSSTCGQRNKMVKDHGWKQEQESQRKIKSQRNNRQRKSTTQRGRSFWQRHGQTLPNRKQRGKSRNEDSKRPSTKATNGNSTPRTARSGNRTTRQEQRFGGTSTTSTSTRKARGKTNLPEQEKAVANHTSRSSQETKRTQRTGKDGQA